MARIRANETPGETSQRLLEAKQSMAVSLGNETQGETTERLLKARQYKAIRRANETKGEATERLLEDRHNKAISRANETQGETTERLLKARQYKAIRRANETKGEATERLLEDRHNKAISRANETQGETTERLLKARQYKAIRRANETKGEATERLLEDRHNKAISRENETQGETTERLLKARQYKAIIRANETKGEATERLLEDRHNKAISRENETTEGTLQRLRLNRERASIILNNPDDKFKGYIIKGNSIIIEKNYLGGLTEICEHCYSKNFKLERPMDKKFNYCCQKGKLVHLHKPKYPVFLRNLLTENSKESKCFQKNIWKYNSTFAFASFGCAHSDINIPKGGPDIFKINGNIYHLTSKNIYPTEGNVPRYAQFYILDSQQALNIRSANPANRNLDSNILRDISSFLTEHNILKNSYKMMIELEKEITKTEGIAPILMLSIVENPFQDQRRYNAPRTNEIAAVFQNVDGEPPFNRDIRVYNKNSNETTNISILHQHLDAMTYPLLIPHAEAGWHSELKIPTTNRSVTQKMFYSNRFAIRDEFNQFLQSGKLVQIYAVDAYTKMEASRLHYIKTHQSKLRVDLYESLRKNYNHHNTEWNQIGNPIVLPSSFIGSSRNMQERYRDTMAIVRKYGKPDLFITMTCNPKWLEITENLNGSSVVNRPDIVSRVFNLKSKELIRDLIKNQIFGKVVAYVYTIEFQKRGLPHMHLLCILDDKSKPNNSELIDKIIWAEIPEENDPSGLNPYVLKHMIHGPCIGSDSGKFLCLDKETIANLNGYPKYQRRNTGKSFKLENKNISVDNRWVVPYSPFLLKKYDCHINVQVCTSIKSVKYIFKYILKGHDCANLEIKYNEIKTYLNSRYVCAPESMYRIFGFDLYSKSHKIERLPVHLEDMHSLVFEEQDDILEVINKPNNKKSMLTAYFDLNINDPEARNYTYAQIPEHYIYNKKERKYHKRSRGGQKVISRIYPVSISDSELFYLRTLLLHRKGATSYEDLKKIGNYIYPDFKSAAIALNLVNDDMMWDKTINEATESKMPYQIRQLFAMICVFHSELKNPLYLWNKYKEFMTEDFVHRNINNYENQALLDIESFFKAHGKTCANYNLPVPFAQDEIIMEYNQEEERILGNAYISNLNSQQKKIFDIVINSVENNAENQRLFCVDGPAGTGKNLSLSNINVLSFRGAGKIVLPCASTGIAATLLKGGRTYHSLFKLPIPLNETSIANFDKDSNLKNEIISSSLIIWDEISMAIGYALTAIDRKLRDVMRDERPFGGKVILFGGDFRQNLPVIKHGHPAQIIESTVKRNPLWCHVKSEKLTLNMRTKDEVIFAEYLLKVGEGELLNDYNLPQNIIEVPRAMISSGDLNSEIFGEKLNFNSLKDNPDKAILCPTNEDTFQINNALLDKLGGTFHHYVSINFIDIQSDNLEQDQLNYPVEFLNSITLSGMPQHKLNIKVGAIVILLKNVNTKRGLCNGTRMIVTELKTNLIYCEVLSGPAKNEIVYIPRIDCSSGESDYPFKMIRRQFPIKISFAMTINKSQGQTFNKVGLYLPNPVFAHGQLYVALSRITKKENIKILIQEKKNQGHLIEGNSAIFTQNIVYREIL
ncbi:hypothetical protein LAZ67_6000238 [Cordylochernes scorpioides]|uniref:ATP-dependent DNA helicase n=1 Tax=Cordylochernes scorpioides TaxID=51811 RepID=A0ABY6KIE8_9ARAC|nr:hypothetical protein LAZ67_6000238 [Cordylochernes scorpioides]